MPPSIVLQSRPLPPKSAHVLTSLALTDVCHCVFISYQAEKEAMKKARHKSKVGEALTVQEFDYIARYSHMAPCCSLACPPQVCTCTDTSRID